MKTQSKTDAASVPRGTNGIATIKVKVHVFHKGEENGFCEWFGCEFISVMGLIGGRNLIELHYSEKETVFVNFGLVWESDKCLYADVIGNNSDDFVAQIGKIACFIFDNYKGVLSVKEF